MRVAGRMEIVPVTNRVLYMKQVIPLAFAVIAGLALVEAVDGSVRSGTVRTSKGDVRILNVYHNESVNVTSAELTHSAFGRHDVGHTGVPDIERFPQVVSLVAYHMALGISRLICSGSLIDGDIVSTAAHCVVETLTSDKEIYAVCGGSVQFRKCEAVRDIYRPSRYDNEVYFLGFDMSVLKLGASILGPEMLRARVNFTKPENSTAALVAGFRTQNDMKFRDARMYYTKAEVVLNDGHCGLLNVLGLDHHTSLICARGASGTAASKGDSGGPLLVKRRRDENYVQVGILSFGALKEDGACDPDFEVAYTSLYDRDHKLLFKFMVRTIAGGTFLTSRFDAIRSDY